VQAVIGIDGVKKRVIGSRSARELHH